MKSKTGKDSWVFDTKRTTKNRQAGILRS